MKLLNHYGGMEGNLSNERERERLTTGVVGGDALGHPCLQGHHVACRNSRKGQQELVEDNSRLGLL